MIWLYIIGSFFIGALLVYLWLSGQLKEFKANSSHHDLQLKGLQADLVKKENTIIEVNKKTNESNRIWLEKEKVFSEKTELLENRIIQKDIIINNLTEEKNRIEKEYIKEIATISSDNRSIKIQLEEGQRLLKEQEEKFNRIEENFKNEFKNMAQEILEEKSKKFAETGKKDLNELIQPLQQKLQDFSKQVKDSYENESKERFNLKEEIKRLSEMNIRLSDQATNLASALKGNSKTQGDWGEMILENMLSDSGLTLGREYLKQESVRDEDGKQLRPDFIIKYPDNRFIIIDSKVSLRSYEAYSASEDYEEKKLLLSQHLKAVSERVNELSTKRYQDQFEGSPDFVMMFMPIEPAFMIAVQSDPQLWNRAYEKRVILMSPTNLIAALKMINELWKHDAQNKNTIAISDAAANLYDKFVGFYNDLEDISKSMDKVTTSFNKAKGKLQTGKGNLISRVQKLKELGIKTKNNLEIDKMTMLEFNEEEENES